MPNGGEWTSEGIGMDVREFAVPFMTGGGDCPPCSDVALTADGRFAKISPNLHEGGGAEHP